MVRENMVRKNFNIRRVAVVLQSCYPVYWESRWVLCVSWANELDSGGAWWTIVRYSRIFLVMIFGDNSGVFPSTLCHKGVWAKSYSESSQLELQMYLSILNWNRPATAKWCVELPYLFLFHPCHLPTSFTEIEMTSQAHTVISRPPEAACIAHLGQVSSNMSSPWLQTSRLVVRYLYLPCNRVTTTITLHVRCTLDSGWDICKVAGW